MTPDGDKFTHAQTRPFEPIDSNSCMWGGVADIINCTKFRENPSMGFGAVRPRKKRHFPLTSFIALTTRACRHRDV